MKKVNLVIVGATGAVGQEILKILDERKFSFNELRLCATARSAGKIVSFQGRDYVIEETTEKSFEGMDVALFAGGSDSTKFAEASVKAGAVVIDNSSAFRLDPNVPLVVPEVNPEDVKWHKGIIANPNCSTIQMVVALKPIYDAVGIERVVVSTYQAASGAGKAGIDELTNHTRAVLEGEEYQHEVFAHPLAFNVIPHIDVFQEMDYTKEEWKMIKETQKILHDEAMRITATTVRVPVHRSHSESINIETKSKLTASKAKELFEAAPGVIVVDNPEQKQYPMPLYSSGTDEVYIGRIREDNSHPSAINLWCVADQIRKGAATNAVQIAELVLKYDCLMK